MKLMRDILTDTDNATYDAIRILAVLSIIVGLGLQIWVVIRWIGPAPQTFDFQDFGVGLGAVFAGVGAALKLQPEAK